MSMNILYYNDVNLRVVFEILMMSSKHRLRSTPLPFPIPLRCFIYDCTHLLEAAVLGVPQLECAATGTEQ